MNAEHQASPIADRLEPFAALAAARFRLLLVFTSAGETAIYFSPPEVDFLFPAPFSRRELLIYKLVKSAVGLVFVALFFSLHLGSTSDPGCSAFVGILLSLAMFQLLGMVDGDGGPDRGRVALYSGAQDPAGGGAGRRCSPAWARSPGTSRPSRIRRGGRGPARVADPPACSWPLSRSSSTRCSPGRGSPTSSGWGAAALAIDLGLLVLILKLDADYLEAAAAISQKIYERIRRAKQGGGVAMPAAPRPARFRLPQPPWLGGAGPVAWRQMLLAIRTVPTHAHYLSGDRGGVRRGESVDFARGRDAPVARIAAGDGHRDDVLLELPLLHAAPLGVSRGSRSHRFPQDAAHASHARDGRRARPAASCS